MKTNKPLSKKKKIPRSLRMSRYHSIVTTPPNCLGQRDATDQSLTPHNEYPLLRNYILIASVHGPLFTI